MEIRRIKTGDENQVSELIRKTIIIGIVEVFTMRFVIQVVSEASVRIDGEIKGSIGRGFMVLVGIGQDDNEKIVDKMVNKMIGLRIFPDDQGKTNLSLGDIGGELLMISQFTLYADCRKGNRPSFIRAGEPDEAKRLYEYAVAKCRERVPKVDTGEFGAEMQVSLVNEGPFTIILDSKEIMGM